MVKKLTALMLSALFITGAALAAKEEVVADAVSGSEAKTNGRRYRNRKSNGNNNGGYVREYTTTDTVVSGGGHSHSRYNGNGCSTGACGMKKSSSCNSHACKDRGCGHCHRAELPPKPCCEKAVTVRTEPCLHKQVQYSWTCPVDYTETACPTC